uniref:Uncharacterized protein n=1 Tax=Romanomermis culicivorax TaxID=13658 RepID=A0A915JP08_ROMCU
MTSKDRKPFMQQNLPPTAWKQYSNKLVEPIKKLLKNVFFDECLIKGMIKLTENLNSEQRAVVRYSMQKGKRLVLASKSISFDVLKAWGCCRFQPKTRIKKGKDQNLKLLSLASTIEASTMIKPPGNLSHLRNYLGDYLPVALSLAVGYLTVVVEHCSDDNNMPHLDFVLYY